MHLVESTTTQGRGMMIFSTKSMGAISVFTIRKMTRRADLRSYQEAFAFRSAFVVSANCQVVADHQQRTSKSGSYRFPTPSRMYGEHHNQLAAVVTALQPK